MGAELSLRWIIEVSLCCSLHGVLQCDCRELSLRWRIGGEFCVVHYMASCKMGPDSRHRVRFTDDLAHTFRISLRVPCSLWLRIMRAVSESSFKPIEKESDCASNLTSKGERQTFFFKDTGHSSAASQSPSSTPTLRFLDRGIYGTSVRLKIY